MPQDDFDRSVSGTAKRSVAAVACTPSSSAPCDRSTLPNTGSATLMAFILAGHASTL